MKRLLASLTAVVLTLAAVPAAEAQNTRRTVRDDAQAAGMRVIRADRTAPAPEGTGVIRYDPGSPTGIRFADGGYYFLGNNFDSQSGTPLSLGTISGFSWYQGPVSGKGGLASFIVVPSTGASPIGGTVSGVSTYATNAVVFSGPISVQPPFFVGVFAAQPQAAEEGGRGSSFNQIGFNTQSTNSQAFHASQRTFSGGGQGTRAPIANQNISLRVSGNVAIPVELLEFEIE